MKPMPQEIEKITSSSLELEEHFELQRKGWQAQRILIVGIFLFIAASVFGLFGNGVLSEKKVEVDGNTLKYEQFARISGEIKLELDLSGSDSIVQVAIPVSYLERFDLKTIVPQPYETWLRPADITYNFKGGSRNKVTFFFTPAKAGGIETVIRGNQTNFKFSHFIYP